MKRLLLLCGFLFCCAVVRAQTEWSVPLDAGWRVQIGDDMAYAQPGFDDSGWRRVELKNQLQEDSPVRQGDMRWYRLHFRAPMPGAVDLVLDAKDGPLEVFVDGKRVSREFQGRWAWRVTPDMVFPLRRNGETGKEDIVIAIRSRYKIAISSRLDDLHAAAAGTPNAVATQAQAWRAAAINSEIASTAIFLVAFVMGILLLVLFAQQRDHREYLWLGVSLICHACAGGLLFTVNSGQLPIALNFFIGDPATYFAIAAEVEFVYAFANKRPGRLVRIYQAVLIATPILLNPFLFFGKFPLSTLDVVETGLVAPGTVLIVVLVLAWYFRGSREAGVLIVPMALVNLATLLFDVEDGIREFNPGFSMLPEWHWYGISISAWLISEILFMLAIGIVLFFRFTQSSREQALQQSEMESARAVQHVMVPDEALETPGFRIESAYKPAQQVGGDFFHIVQLPADAGTMVVIGDVSGKGVPAALNVALIVGVLRAMAEKITSPAEVLQGLNRALCGRSAGFTTCLAMRVQTSGLATISNAGHIAPYLLGAEVAVENGLPLGIVEDAEYGETTVQLAAGAVLTMMTDGVVEAQNPLTGELFGFGRTAEISGQTAEHIAETARSFGQSDDIAVLTVQYAPVGVSEGQVHGTMVSNDVHAR